VLRKIMRVFIFIAILPVSLVIMHHKDIILGTSGVHKLRMPGTYYVNLPKGIYGIWNYSVWTSKGLNGKKSDLRLTVLDQGSGTKMDEKNFGNSDNFNTTLFGKTAGSEERNYTIMKDGTYTFSSNQNCVVVIVPQDQSTFFMSADGYIGENDDLNFDSPVSQ